ncbi:DciA family protein [Streptomyces olivaceoviridis]|uniref:DciA family protein n=1 Tax=Streptomyces olivaceoviridis TaxID=1921 RepID=UPI0036FAA83D
MPEQIFGADLARQALARARAAAKTAPPTKSRAPKRTRQQPGAGRDPQALSGILGTLAAEEGWKDSLGGGSILDRWTELCPTAYADTTRPTGFDSDTGTLTVKTASHTVAAHLRLMERQLVGYINGKVGRTLVRRVRVGIGGDSPQSADATGAATAPSEPEPEGPVKTRETASAGYQTTLEAALTHRRPHQPTDPYTLEAIARQEAAARANRLPETEHTEGQWAQAEAERKAGPRPGSLEASIAAAIARKRQEAAGLTEPRRAFDVA